MFTERQVIKTLCIEITFGPKRDEVTGEWRKLHNEKFHDLHSSPTIERLIKSIRLRWTGHIARMERGEACTGCLWKNLRERDPSVDWRIILEWIFRKWDVGVWTGLG
jgi:hypothetical protein